MCDRQKAADPPLTDLPPGRRAAESGYVGATALSALAVVRRPRAAPTPLLPGALSAANPAGVLFLP
jgi:hypothetical protein